MLLRGSVALVAGIVGVASAQEPSDNAPSLPTIVITGSYIPRPHAESVLPMQILTREDIQRSGASTTPELMGKVSANMLGSNDQLGIGDTAQPGLSSANLRGIGDGSTLVLLNGRRVANYAFNGGTVDLNSIPISAIDRVEILKDGASALYGADAIAGVINFILRKDFRGIESGGYSAWTEHGGADQRQVTASVGYGDLAKDRFNVFATLSHQKEDALHALDRPFSRTGYLPAEGVNMLSGVSYPANIQVGPGLIVSPAFATGCAPPASIPVNIPFLSLAPICGYDFTSSIDLIPPAERTSMVGRSNFQINEDNEVFVETNYAYNRFVFKNSPTSVFQGPASSSEPVLYPDGGPYYPTTFAAANGISGDLNLRFRTVPLGPQTNATDTHAWRLVAGAEGTAWGWSYGTAIAYSENRQIDRFVSGFVSRQRLIPALATGLINPFGPSAPAGNALFANTQIIGDTHHGTGTTLGLDIRASKEIYKLPGGPLALALGGDIRREKLENLYTAVWTSGDVLGQGGDQQSASGRRTVGAAFAEVSVPAAKGLEAQIAVRFDRYSDFGDTTNPKIALRWQPTHTLSLRASWANGFRAPTLYDLFTPSSQSFVADPAFQDPVRCPVTGLPVDCDGVYKSVMGGNPHLRPEVSDQFNAGVVWEPLARLSLDVDYWKINKSSNIGALNETVVFEQFTRYAPTNIRRGPVDPKFPNLPGPIEAVLLANQNLGNLRTSGIDVGTQWRGPNSPIGSFGFRLDGTYALRWDQQLDGIHYTSALGRRGLGIAGPVPRWRHIATVNWNHDPWGATLAQTYQSGYDDANVDRRSAPLRVPPRRVGNYSVWDLQVRYNGFPHTVLAIGINNFLDDAPPFSNQPFSRQVGYDPAYADPRGRICYLQLTYAFI